MFCKKTVVSACLVFITGQVTPSFCLAAINSSQQAKTELSRVTDQIKAAESEHKKLREKARAVQKEILDVRRKMVSAAGSIQEQEESLGRLEEKLHELEDRQAAIKERLEIRKMQRMKVLAALQNLAWKPTEALLAQPLPPQDTLRSALLLREAVPRLEYSTEGLRKDLTKLASLTSAIRAQYAQIKTMARHLEAKRRNMNVLIEKKTKLQSSFASESSRAKERATALAKQAGDLKDLLARLEAESVRRQKLHQTAALPKGAFKAAKGNIPYPVKGTVIKKFGDPTDSGLSARGITIRTRSNAQVISPYDGTVLFAGPFRGY